MAIEDRLEATSMLRSERHLSSSRRWPVLAAAGALALAGIASLVMVAVLRPASQSVDHVVPANDVEAAPDAPTTATATPKNLPSCCHPTGTGFVHTPTVPADSSIPETPESQSSRPPTANDDSAATSIEQSILIDVLANDTDAEGDALVVQSIGQPTRGIASLVANNIRYDPEAGFSGVDSFTYTISDPTGLTSTATAMVTVRVLAGANEPVDDSSIPLCPSAGPADPSVAPESNASHCASQAATQTRLVEWMRQAANPDTYTVHNGDYSSEWPRHSA